MGRDGTSVGRPLVAALGLAAVEIGWVTAATREPFRGPGEWGWYALTSVSVTGAMCLVLWAVGSAVARGLGASGTEPDRLRRRRAARRVGWVVAALALAIASPGLWLLTAGRRLREAPGRGLVVGLLSLAIAVAVGWLGRRMTERTRHPQPGGWRGSAALGVLAIVALILDAAVLRRLYPALHAMLAAAAVASALAATVLAPRRGPGVGRWPVALGLAVMVLAPLSLRGLLARDNAAFVTERWAPIAGKLTAMARPAVPRRPVPPAVERPPEVEPGGARAAGPDLAGRSVLVITVDALRADRLAVHGGHGRTPHMDALASEGAVFDRAVTPTPHTSYALGSLWTGRDLRLTSRLDGAGGSPVTVAERFAQAGYRTAAFFPPAVFYVDRERFAGLAESGFGFAHRAVDRASAPARVRQLRAWLDTVPRDEPLLVWTHLFEPHEPYDPPPGWARGDDDAARYDGEVAVADAAVGDLVRVFREKRPRGTVVLTADHGEELGDHGGHFHGTTLYAEQVRVPLLWSSPGTIRPRIIEAPADLTDVAVTLLSAAGLPPTPAMTGDDLGPVLAGGASGPRHAFASVRDARMATDGRHKVICRAGGSDCRLYDLARDPSERRNLAADRPAMVRRLRAALGRHLARVASSAGAVDAQAVLGRARMGDPTVGPSLVPLLAADGARVRAGAARGLGELGHRAARTMLQRLAREDPDGRVRREAAVAAASMGDRRMVARVASALRARREGRASPPTGWDLRAALVLAEADSAQGVPELVAVAGHDSGSVEARRRAVVALGELRASSAVPVLIELLGDIRLRIEAARALGRIGDRRALGPLARALRDEPYPDAREAEVEALEELEHPRWRALAARYLGSKPAR